MDSVLVIGGTRFIGRQTVTEFQIAGYDVTILTRGQHPNPFDEGVDHITGDRRERATLETARNTVDPDLVVDCVAYFPEDVTVATDVFGDDARYVYVSSGAAYGVEQTPKREDKTPLAECTTEQARTDSRQTYGPRKAEGDRRVFAAAESGVHAMSVRPTVVYGPYDYTERFAYWVDRVDTYDQVLLPSDGLSLWQMAYVGDVASAIRLVAERGRPGQAYNVGDEHAPTLREWIDLLADACQTSVETVGVGARELARAGLTPDDFPIYRDHPHLLTTAKLRDLGWSSTPQKTALVKTVAEHRKNDRTGREFGPNRADEESLIERLTS